MMGGMRKIERGPLAGYWIGFPMGEHMMDRDSNSFTCDIYPEIGERNCEINGKRVGPVVYRREKRRIFGKHWGRAA